MKAEYKRDLSGNYLVLYEEEEPDTSSYQMRMLVGNTIPSVLKCRVQGVDGQFMVCFDITSKQAADSPAAVSNRKRRLDMRTFR